MALTIDVAQVQGKVDELIHGSNHGLESSQSRAENASRTKTLTVFLVRNVTNAAAVRAEILSAATADTPGASNTTPDASGDAPSEITDASFIDASVIPSLRVIQAAAGMACQNLPALKAKTLHAELIWSLSGSKHIGRALSTFGIQDTSTNVLVAKFDATPEDVRALQARVVGEVVEGNAAIEAALREVCDVERVKKVYGIRDAELEIGGLEESVVLRIAARDCAF